MKIFGERLKELRNKANMSQKELAELLCINDRTISRYEKGKTAPDIYNLLQICELFGVNIDYLLGVKEIEKQMQRIKKGSHRSKAEMKMRSRYWEVYNKAKNNYKIMESAKYYYIRYNKEIDWLDAFSGYTMWTGFTEDMDDIRGLAPINAAAFMEFYRDRESNKKPMVINDDQDFGAYFIYGGEALIREELCRKYIPQLMHPIIVNKNDVI